MGKLKKYPKEPKAGASKDSLMRYKKNCEKVAAANKAIEKDAAEKKKIRDDAKKLKSKK